MVVQLLALTAVVVVPAGNLTDRIAPAHRVMMEENHWLIVLQEEVVFMPTAIMEVLAVAAVLHTVVAAAAATLVAAEPITAPTVVVAVVHIMEVSTKVIQQEIIRGWGML